MTCGSSIAFPRKTAGSSTNLVNWGNFYSGTGNEKPTNIIYSAKFTKPHSPIFK